MHLAVAGITRPGEASTRLPEHPGFRYVGRFQEVGFQQGRQVDVGYRQLLL